MSNPVPNDSMPDDRHPGVTVLHVASVVVARQTRRVRRFLRKNRNRVVYRVEGDDGCCRNVYSLRGAVRLARAHPGGWIIQGEQNARWIAAGNLTGIRWQRKRQWFVR